MTIKTAFVFIDRQNEYIHQFSPQYSGECLYKWLHCDMMKEQFRRILQSTEDRREDHWCFFLWDTDNIRFLLLQKVQRNNQGPKPPEQ